MITLALFRAMADEIDDLVSDPNSSERNFYWEEAPLQSNGDPAKGVWLVTRGGDASMSPKKLNLKTTVDFYVAFNNKVQTEVFHKAILDWLIANRAICELGGSVDGTDYSFTNIRIQPATTPQNEGATENGLIVKVASAQLVYDIN